MQHYIAQQRAQAAAEQQLKLEQQQATQVASAAPHAQEEMQPVKVQQRLQIPAREVADLQLQPHGLRLLLGQQANLYGVCKASQQQRQQQQQQAIKPKLEDYRVGRWARVCMILLIFIE